MTSNSLLDNMIDMYNAAPVSQEKGMADPLTEQEITPESHPERGGLGVKPTEVPDQGTVGDMLAGKSMPKSFGEAWSNLQQNVKDVVSHPEGTGDHPDGVIKGEGHPAADTNIAGPPIGRMQMTPISNEQGETGQWWNKKEGTTQDDFATLEAATQARADKLRDFKNVLE